MPVLTAPSNFPADDIVAVALRNVVQDRCQVGQIETLTINDVRAAVESKLGLASGCIKENKRWRELSKDIIRAEFEAHERGDDAQAAVAAIAAGSDGSAVSPASTERQAASAPTTQGAAKPGRPAAPNEPQKRRRSFDCEPTSTEEPPVTSSPSSQATATGDGPVEKHSDGRRHVRTIAGAKRQQSLKDGAGVEVTGRGAHRSGAAEPPENLEVKVMESESDMSVVVDEEPAKRESKKCKAPYSESQAKAKARSKTFKKTKTKTGKSRPSPTRDGDGGEGDLPAQSEIKLLQSRLSKCGVRKMWHKELSPHATPQAKIGHLRGLLKDVGMTGRFSAEKAKRIKARRELQAEVDDLQTETKRRGDGREIDESNVDDGDEGVPGPKRRKLARGLRDLDFLDESGREESD